MSKETYENIEKIDDETIRVTRKVMTESTNVQIFKISDLKEIKKSKQIAIQQTRAQSTASIIALEAQVKEIDDLIKKMKDDLNIKDSKSLDDVIEAEEPERVK